MKEPPQAATLLARLCREHGAPAAAAWWRHDGFEQSLACGTEDLERTRPATTATRYFLGSLSKLVTAIGILQLLDEDRLAIEDPVVRHLPADEARAPVLAGVSIGQLLDHTSGMHGDRLWSPSQGDDALRAYVLALDDAPRLHAPGACHSYCNAGYSVLGRVIEHHRGMPWDRHACDVLFPQLGMHGAGALHCGTDWARHAAPLRIGPPGSRVRAARFSTETRALGPFGATLYGTLPDVVRLARLLLGRGCLGGERILSEAAFAAMAARRVEGPCHSFADAWGLGLMHFRTVGGAPMVGHDGALGSFESFVRVLPAHDAALVMQVNGRDCRAVQRRFFDDVLGQPLGIGLPQPQPVPGCVALAPYGGEFAQPGYRLSSTPRAGELELTLHPTLFARDVRSPETSVLEPCDRELFVARRAGIADPVLERFLDFDADGVPQALNFRGRLFRRVPAELTTG